MTAANGIDHDISEGFVWEPKYEQQLREVADTDEVDPSIEWLSFRDAIKYKIKETIASYPASPPPVLHPAAAHIPPSPQASSSTYANGTASGLTTATAATGLASRFAAEGSEPGPASSEATLVGADNVNPADQQGFYASKRQPPPTFHGSWGRRLDEDGLSRERTIVFGMLDEFEDAPPFTIQRLCELVLFPRRHQKTLPKYFSALRRLLSVTATRNAFPASPPASPAAAEANGLPADGSIPVLGAHANGPSASRSPSPAQRAFEPLFSPIPFLVRDAPDPAHAHAAAQEALAEVPEMELGGADRTHEHAADAISAASASVAASEGAMASSEDASAMHSNPEMSGAVASSLAPASGSLGAGAGMPNHALEGLPNAMANQGSPPGPGGPLGVPKGRVDELDDTSMGGHGKMDGEVHPLSSTTDMTGIEVGASQQQSHPQERIIKRIRSEKSLGDCGSAEPVRAPAEGDSMLLDEDVKLATAPNAASTSAEAGTSGDGETSSSADVKQDPTAGAEGGAAPGVERAGQEAAQLDSASADVTRASGGAEESSEKKDSGPAPAPAGTGAVVGNGQDTMDEAS